MDTAARFAPFKWAQNAERVLMTINVTDCENIEVDVVDEDSRLIFKATSNGQKYELDFATHKPILKEKSAWNTKGRHVLINLGKKEKDEDEWWPRITKEKTKNQLITIDWARWVDPDEEDEKPESGAGGQGDFDPSMMQNMMGGGGGMGGMPGMGGMGGMPGMPGMGGMGGMPGMPGMGGMGGMGGMEGMDMQKLMAQMGGGAGGMMPPGADEDSDEEDEQESQAEPHSLTSKLEKVDVNDNKQEEAKVSEAATDAKAEAKPDAATTSSQNQSDSTQDKSQNQIPEVQPNKTEEPAAENK